jgi:hypothetical protein
VTALEKAMIRNELALLGLVLFVLLTVGGMLYFEAAALETAPLY